MNYPEIRYLERLADLYPTIASASTEVINMEAILNLPKGTEHFLTDIHGEDEAFAHVLKNGSGSVRRKVNEVFGNTLSHQDKRTLATLIYYPREKMDQILKVTEDKDEWFRITLYRLIEICKRAASKYTRSKVRKAMPPDFAYVLEELITEKDDSVDKASYYNAIVNTIIHVGRGRECIIAMSQLIQRLVIDHLHIVGDIFDRGPGPHKIMDKLMDYHSVDIQCTFSNIVQINEGEINNVFLTAHVKGNAWYGSVFVGKNYGVIRNCVTVAPTYSTSNQGLAV